ncbi:hypothetical protein ASF48_07720 [Rathayibacter sp. Leaf299]|uniref:GNAT family N-acetyltransferase n=1 Tax=Rathayibacter sp. Leaf299 TaxID=1736328 RepID=UPI0006FB9097|nr:GNAT family N-acetyltransferase [Rathayibacter sp. Leaf299]KQQ20518.1 hypothetical protein ASF48_07720 [Rathayibacter sp. Leaf299]
MNAMMPERGPAHLHAAGMRDVDDVSELSLETFGEKDGANRLEVAHSVANWRERRSPRIVARGDDGHFMGYAIVNPNRGGDFWRTDGQVAILTHVAVAAEFQGDGVGSALLERAVRTARMLGWARLMAQIPSGLVSWYRSRGWIVQPERELLAWVEPWVESDDHWHPELPSRAFSPVLYLEHCDDYPHVATLQLREEPPILEVSFPAGRDSETTEALLGQAIATALLERLSLARRLPPALVETLAETPGLPSSCRRMLLAELAVPAIGRNSSR